MLAEDEGPMGPDRTIKIDIVKWSKQHDGRKQLGRLRRAEEANLLLVTNNH